MESVSFVAGSTVEFPEQMVKIRQADSSAMRTPVTKDGPTVGRYPAGGLRIQPQRKRRTFW